MEQKQIPIGKLLQEAGYINQEQIEVALNVQKADRLLLGEILQNLDFVTPTEIAIAVARQYGFDYVDLDEKLVTNEALSIVPFEMAQSKMILPMHIKDGELVVAVDSVNDYDTIDYLKTVSTLPIKYVVADKNKIEQKIELKYYQFHNPIDKQIETMVDAFVANEEVEIVELVKLILNDAIKDGATDIHITPDVKVLYVFYRIDGVLHLSYTIPKVAMQQISSRIKILSKMDISEQRLPQDGGFSHEFIGSRFDLRVSTIPTDNGENIVMRILSSDTASFNLGSLGFEDDEAAKLKELFNKPYGIVLVTGPTGSGKTTTLYSLLRHINFIEKNVITIEDPIEYRFSFIRQTEVNLKSGYTFDRAIRHFMRQDPDAMLVGEMRDEETAELAVRAAITGHLVLSTLHTNDAAGAIPRLLDLGVKDYLISSSVLAILAQRLVRRLCPSCKEPVQVTQDDLVDLGFEREWLDTSTDEYFIFKEVGCDLCKKTGYKGREAIIEILTITDEIKEMINGKKSPLEIFRKAQDEGMRSLKQNAVRKVLQGKTSLNEIKRVII
ncbi:MAG: ATPase, T2SS/T4P/T4SS family [Campylobacterota bacterium]|nr:ATPase, T2SS/T4P/T4SS family [Campylobacterota bacterium]